MILITIISSIGMIVVEFFTEADFSLAHKVTDISLGCLFFAATLMMIYSFCKLSNYFDFFLAGTDVRKMNLSAGV